MAKVKLTAFIGDIRGKIGGSVFVKSAGGLVLRNNTSPVNKNTVSQSDRKNIEAGLQWDWQRLTQRQRDCWVEWTKLNPIPQIRDVDLVINAQQTFLKLNFYRRMAGISIIKDPNFDTTLIEPIGATVALAPFNIRLVLDRPLNDDLELFILFLTFRVTPTVNNPRTGFRYIKFDQSPGASNYPIANSYFDVFGHNPVAGEQLFMKYTTADKLSGKLLSFQSFKIFL